MKGFTLLEVMVALAIMASVIVTLIGATNYHLGLLQGEQETTVLTILARQQLESLAQKGAILKAEGTLTPLHPNVRWSTELFPTKLPSVQKVVLTLKKNGEKSEVALVRYVLQ